MNSAKASGAKAKTAKNSVAKVTKTAKATTKTTNKKAAKKIAPKKSPIVESRKAKPQTKVTKPKVKAIKPAKRVVTKEKPEVVTLSNLPITLAVEKTVIVEEKAIKANGIAKVELVPAPEKQFKIALWSVDNRRFQETVHPTFVKKEEGAKFIETHDILKRVKPCAVRVVPINFERRDLDNMPRPNKDEIRGGISIHDYSEN